MKKKNLFLKSTSSLLAMLFVVMSAFMFTACDDTEDGDEDPEPEPENSILEIVAESESHTQLEAFVTADEDLSTALGGNNLTLFAPNDAAFEKLRTTLGVESLNQVNPSVIKAVLTYHAVTSVELRESFNEDTELTTLQGENITFNSSSNIATGGSDSDVEFIGDEILATNGVVHVVETILVPPTIYAAIGTNLGKVSQTILLSANFSTLAAAIQKADAEYAAITEGVTPLSTILAGAAEGLPQITVLAPPNQVFEAGGLTVDSFNPQQWYGIIANHVIGSKELRAEFTYVDANNIVTFSTLAGGTITVVPSGGLDSNGQSGAEATFAVDPETGEEIVNIESDNGVVHAIAGVLLPASSGRYAIDAKYGMNK